MKRKAVVLLSGGIDSLVIAETELIKGTLAGVVFVDMDHPARVAEEWKVFNFQSRAAVPFKVIRVTGLDLGDMADASHASVVPSRNLILLSVASNVGKGMGGNVILMGANETDAADYLDCRREALAETSRAFESMGGLPIEAPLIDQTKVDVIMKARDLGITFKDSWSCYRPGPIPCRMCSSCLEAQTAWGTNTNGISVQLGRYGQWDVIVTANGKTNLLGFASTKSKAEQLAAGERLKNRPPSDY